MLILHDLTARHCDFRCLHVFTLVNMSKCQTKTTVFHRIEQQQTWELNWVYPFRIKPRYPCSWEKQQVLNRIFDWRIVHCQIWLFGYVNHGLPQEDPMVDSIFLWGLSVFTGCRRLGTAVSFDGHTMSRYMSHPETNPYMGIWWNMAHLGGKTNVATSHYL